MDSLTSRQLSEWEAYDRIDPIGTWTDYMKFAQLESLIFNIVSKLYTKKGHTPVTTTPADFMPNWSMEKKEPKRQTVEEQKKILLDIFGKHNKKEANNKRIPKSLSKKKEK